MHFSLADAPLLIKWMTVYGVLTLRYLLIAGIAFLVFYFWKKRPMLHRRIQKHFPKNRDYWREIGYSMLTFTFFASMAVVIFALKKQGYTQIYSDFSAKGTGYFFLSIFLALLIHDTYFYWMHRFMHLPPVFKVVHKVHHLSHNPSPWAAFSFHPLEAVIEAGILPVLVFLIPIHPLAILSFLLLMTFDNVLGHLGFELFPKNFTRHSVGKWFNTSTHHNMHHKYVRCNYGLYFNLWDRVMGTNHRHYHAHFDEITLRNPEQSEQIAHERPEHASIRNSGG